MAEIGNRNNTLHELASSLYKLGMSYTELKATILEANHDFNTPLNLKEVQQTILQPFAKKYISKD